MVRIWITLQYKMRHQDTRIHNTQTRANIVFQSRSNLYLFTLAQWIYGVSMHSFIALWCTVDTTGDFLGMADNVNEWDWMGAGCVSQSGKEGERGGGGGGQQFELVSDCESRKFGWTNNIQFACFRIIMQTSLIKYRHNYYHIRMHTITRAHPRARTYAKNTDKMCPCQFRIKCLNCENVHHIFVRRWWYSRCVCVCVWMRMPIPMRMLCLFV